MSYLLPVNLYLYHSYCFRLFQNSHFFVQQFAYTPTKVLPYVIQVFLLAFNRNANVLRVLVRPM
jgi:hypothetical protein